MSALARCADSSRTFPQDREVHRSRRLLGGDRFRRPPLRPSVDPLDPGLYQFGKVLQSVEETATMFYPSAAADRCWTRARTCPANGARRPGTCNGRAAAACLEKMESMMARWHIGATEFDRRVARAVARNARPAIERPARLLTWIADEHLLVAITAGLWLAARRADDDARRQADHLVLSVAAAAVLPHPQAADRPGAAGSQRGSWPRRSLSISSARWACSITGSRFSAAARS